MYSHRLPWTIVPERYEIRIEPDLLSGTFAGTETVEVTVREPVSEIVLNAAELHIQEVAIQDTRGRVFPGTATFDEGSERVQLRFPTRLTPGPWRLRLTFTGILNDRLRGFYRCRVKASAGGSALGSTESGDHATSPWLAATQFEATDARRAFPCWDEPSFKAVFQVSLVVAEGLTALSNSRTVSETPIPGSGRRVVTFAPTIKMSTYLLAFVVGNLEATEPAMVDGTPIRIWCAPGKVHLAGFGREIAVFSLRFFQEYYGIPYPGDKLDLIAIPDFAFGAMENLGAIVFRENALLIDEQAATHVELERVADVVAHEVAHMWFGDLVTMAWWNGLWLNEAFATFMEVLAVDAWKSGWQRWVTFAAARADALQVDGLESSRPIEFEVNAPQDAEAMFDVLTYQKGGAVLRMLEQFLGSEVFRDGVRKYLADHQFGTAVSSDLWNALTDVSVHPIAPIMDGWIFRPGYPIVTVRTEDGGGTVCFSQRRFTYLGEGADASGVWQVPITYRVRANGEVRIAKLLLSSAEDRVKLPVQPDWVVANAGGHGFYRVAYGRGLLERLAERLSEIMRPIERFNLVNDTWASVLAGLLPVGEYLDLTGRLRDESDRYVWEALLASYTYLHRIVESTERSGLEGLVQDRLGPAVARLGWSPSSSDNELARQLRGELLRAVGTLGNDATVQARARDLYISLRNDPSKGDPSVRAALIAIRAHTGGAAEYAEFLEQFKTAKTPQEEQRYLHALAGFRDAEFVRQTLDLSLSGEVRAQDAPYLVQRLLMSVHARDLAWSFVKDHWEAMERRYPQSGFRRMCEGITALATPVLEPDVRRFFSSRNVSLGGKALEQYLEQLRIAVTFRAREGSALATYLSRFR